jgi:integrase
MGKILDKAERDENLATMVSIVRQIALTGCRRSEIIELRWSDVDLLNSCLRLSETKEGASTRPIGLAVVEFLETQSLRKEGPFVFPGTRGNNAFGNFPKRWC